MGVGYIYKEIKLRGARYLWISDYSGVRKPHVRKMGTDIPEDWKPPGSVIRS